LIDMLCCQAEDGIRDDLVTVVQTCALPISWLSMGKRREARERAVQFLFQHDLNPPEDLDRALEQFWQSQRGAAIAEEKGIATWRSEERRVGKERGGWWGASAQIEGAEGRNV